MKKRFTLILALGLAAVLLTGCGLTQLLLVAGVQGRREMPAKSNDASDADVDVCYEEAEAYDAYAMAPAMTSMPVMAASGMAAYDGMVARDERFSTEEYASTPENGFRNVQTSPLSTFSADVDTASYCNLRRMLNDGWTPEDIPAGAVRVEEMLNYFHYSYAAPADGAKFGVTAEIAACPWNPEAKLLMLGIRAADAPGVSEEGSNLVFLVDVSGSMGSEDKLGLVKKALTLLLDQLTEKDTVSICTYSDGEQILIEGGNPVKDRAKLIIAIEGMEARGYTNGQRGLAQAYEVAMRYYRPHGNNRVIMCSDGDLNVGITSESDLHEYVSKQKDTGVYLSVLGFGDGNYKDTKMETLADNGNGNYYYIDSLLEARKVLVEELTQTLYAVADDVKFQIEFNPAKVAAWRQVGYENRALADEDFDNDQRDAGEVGAGAQVTVMYELIPAGDASVDSGLKYQTGTLTEAAAGDEWLTLSIRYKEPGGSESKLESVTVGEADVTDAPSSDFNFAAAVAEFGMLLGRSEHIGSTDYASVVALLKASELSDDYREEMFSLVKIAQRADQLKGIQ